MDVWGRYEASEPLEELKRREQELGAAVRRRLGQPIDEPGRGRGKGNDAAASSYPSGASRARTGDPRLAKAVLSQLSYGP